MRYIFFFSYARDNRDQYLLRFYKDLERRVAVHSGLTSEEKEETQIAFLDESNLELGGEWDPELVEALQNSAVLICAYSPSYFVSEYCSREWHVFQMRRRSWPRFLAGEAPLPPAIKPVIWVSPTRRMTREAVHEDVFGVQYKLGETNAIYNTDGVEPMLRMINRYSDQYEEFMDELARSIITAADMMPPLPVLGPPVPRLSEIAPLFPLRKRVPATIPQPEQDAVFPRQCSPLVFVAATLDGAGAGEGADAPEVPVWRPFGPGGDCIDSVVQAIAVRDLNTACRIEHVTSMSELTELVERADAHYQALVILSDPASAEQLVRAADHFRGFPLLVLDPAAAPPSGQNAVASPDALRALLVSQVPRLLSKTRAHVPANLPSSKGKPVISASNR